MIQGSGTGPVSYVVNASDLRTIFSSIYSSKYADDTHLIVPASLSHTIEMELKFIADWATANILTLNTKKINGNNNSQFQIKKCQFTASPSN